MKMIQGTGIKKNTLCHKLVQLHKKNPQFECSGRKNGVQYPSIHGNKNASPFFHTGMPEKVSGVRILPHPYLSRSVAKRGSGEFPLH